MKIEDLTKDRPLTICGGTGTIGDPVTYATAAAFAAEVIRRADKKAPTLAIVAGDPWAAAWWMKLAGVEHGERYGGERFKVIGAPEVWPRASGTEVGSAIGEAVRGRKPDHLIVVDHGDPAPERWAWARKVAGVKQTTVFTTSPATDAEWRLFPGKPQDLPNLVAPVLASQSGTTHTLTVKGTSFRPDPGPGNFTTDEPTRASFNWRAGGVTPDVNAWREAIAEAEAEASRLAAAQWFDGIRPVAEDVPKALLDAAPWLAAKRK